MIEDDTTNAELDTFVIGDTDVAVLGIVSAGIEAVFEQQVAGGIPI